jgi:transglutaminase-like putative cysteine protease
LRIHIAHETAYRYATPASHVVQILRLTPRDHDGQHVVQWRIDVSADARLEQHEDAFGNISHTFSADGPFNELTVTVDGVVETQDTHGVVRSAVERFPPGLFLRETPLTHADAAIAAFAADIAGNNRMPPLDLMHSLVRRLHDDIVFDTSPTQSSTTAAEAFALKRGVCQDLTHIFLAAARLIGVPARYVGGYLRRADGVVGQEAGHAWAEAFIPDLGWVAFDPANGISATDAHVRVAVGLDYLGAAPVRGSRQGGRDETLAVKVHVDQAGNQTQA